MTRWTVSDTPPQPGRTAIVTGTGGLGPEDALALAGVGARVILAGRSAAKGAGAVARIGRRFPQTAIRFERFDLADLHSVADFAERILQYRHSIDLLINNAGVIVPSRRTLTADGFELQLSTNYLGHFALTAYLLPLLSRACHARAVSFCSIAAPQGRIDLADLIAERSYKPMQVYAQSKLACLMFAFELQRRSDAAGWGITSIAAQPGVARTDLLHNGSGRASIRDAFVSGYPSSSRPRGAAPCPSCLPRHRPMPSLAAIMGRMDWRICAAIPPGRRTPPQALDMAMAARLLTTSEALVGLRFDAAGASATLASAA
ncbi:SDR family NAD(P)-dependent oxidoreductase [Sphingomonas spermidinifaciens]|uniref:SDR family NAD(P)-dependent oxidoreductase n=1 Tax=Sphingomonas spermidinifaciens TaxID=1141889 RepID=UPI001C3E8EE5|nr:SDR family NAD(P)-dependent oxidoreductase [Sphingomonas spermidinifaciens]